MYPQISPAKFPLVWLEERGAGGGGPGARQHVLGGAGHEAAHRDPGLHRAAPDRGQGD